MWLSWLERRPVDRKGAGSTPGQGTYSDCEFDPQWCAQEGSQSMFLSHISVSLSLSLSPPPSLSKSNDKMSSGEDKKIKILKNKGKKNLRESYKYW